MNDATATTMTADEPGGNGIREPLDRRTAALRFGDHLNDARQHRIRPDFLGAHDQASGAVDSTADRLVTRRFLHRHGFAGHHGFVDRATTLDHHAVDRHAVAWAHAQAIADLNCFKQYVFVAAVGSDTPRGFRREIEQSANGVAGLLACAQLQDLAEENKHGDDGGSLVINRNDAVLPQILREQPGRKGRGKAVEIGGADAERDQAEHVQRTIVHRRPAASEEWPARP